jgi:hypothetical protein
MSWHAARFRKILEIAHGDGSVPVNADVAGRNSGFTQIANAHFERFRS